MNNRAELLFTLVCKRAERVSVEQFALQHNVTSRTVYKDVERLSALLQAKGYPRIDNIRGILEYKSPIDIDFSGLLKKNDLFYFDPEIRRRYIVEMILLRPEKVSVASIQTLTGISRNTVLRDLDEIKEMLAEKGILLESIPFVGYTVVGKSKREGSLCGARNILTVSIYRCVTRVRNALPCLLPRQLRVA